MDLILLKTLKASKDSKLGQTKDWHQFHFSSRLCHNHSYQYPKLPIIGLTYYESYQTGTFHNVVQRTDQLGNVPQCGATRSLPRQLWHGSPCPGCSGRGHPEPSFIAFLNHCAILSAQTALAWTTQFTVSQGGEIRQPRPIRAVCMGQPGRHGSGTFRYKRTSSQLLRLRAHPALSRETSKTATFSRLI